MSDRDIDALISGILQGMGVDPSKPPHWKTYIHKVIDQTTREIVHEIKDGYICSYCGKHSYSQKDKCDGCNSIMKKE